MGCVKPFSAGVENLAAGGSRRSWLCSPGRANLAEVRRKIALVLRVASAPVGVAVGLWTAQLTTFQSQCTPSGLCLDRLSLSPAFAMWQCALFGAGAAAVLLLLSLAVARLPVSRPV